MDNTVQIYWERYNEDMRKAYARGLRAAARQARREAKNDRESHARFGCFYYKLFAAAEQDLACWCDRRARAVERGK